MEIVFERAGRQGRANAAATDNCHLFDSLTESEFQSYIASTLPQGIQNDAHDPLAGTTQVNLHKKGSERISSPILRCVAAIGSQPLSDSDSSAVRALVHRMAIFAAHQASVPGGLAAIEAAEQAQKVEWDELRRCQLHNANAPASALGKGQQSVSSKPQGPQKTSEALKADPKLDIAQRSSSTDSNIDQCSERCVDESEDQQDVTEQESPISLKAEGASVSLGLETTTPHHGDCTQGSTTEFFTAHVPSVNIPGSRMEHRTCQRSDDNITREASECGDSGTLPETAAVCEKSNSAASGMAVAEHREQVGPTSSQPDAFPVPSDCSTSRHSRYASLTTGWTNPLMEPCVAGASRSTVTPPVPQTKAPTPPLDHLYTPTQGRQVAQAAAAAAAAASLSAAETSVHGIGSWSMSSGRGARAGSVVGEPNGPRDAGDAPRPGNTELVVGMRVEDGVPTMQRRVVPIVGPPPCATAQHTPARAHGMRAQRLSEGGVPVRKDVALRGRTRSEHPERVGMMVAQAGVGPSSASGRAAPRHAGHTVHTAHASGSIRRADGAPKAAASHDGGVERVPLALAPAFVPARARGISPAHGASGCQREDGRPASRGAESPPRGEYFAYDGAQAHARQGQLHGANDYGVDSRSRKARLAFTAAAVPGCADARASAGGRDSMLGAVDGASARMSDAAWGRTSEGSADRPPRSFPGMASCMRMHAEDCHRHTCESMVREGTGLSGSVMEGVCSGAHVLERRTCDRDGFGKRSHSQGLRVGVDETESMHSLHTGMNDARGAAEQQHWQRQAYGSGVGHGGMAQDCTDAERLHGPIETDGGMESEHFGLDERLAEAVGCLSLDAVHVPSTVCSSSSIDMGGSAYQGGRSSRPQSSGYQESGRVRKAASGTMSLRRAVSPSRSGQNADSGVPRRGGIPTVVDQKRVRASFARSSGRRRTGEVVLPGGGLAAEGAARKRSGAGQPQRGVANGRGGVKSGGKAGRGGPGKKGGKGVSMIGSFTGDADMRARMESIRKLQEETIAAESKGGRHRRSRR